MTALLISARNLRRSYDNADVQALRGVDLDVRPGEFVSIMGPSGSGKSTLLNVLGGLDAEFEGDVVVDGLDMRVLPDPSSFRAHIVGFVFQTFHLLPTLTALENVQMPMFAGHYPARERQQRAARLLTSLGLAGRMHHIPAKLSGGERQRVAIARSLANEPRLLLADEPTGNLDSASTRSILDVLRQVHEQSGITIILVTHDPAVAAKAGRCIQMLDGRIVADQAVGR